MSRMNVNINDLIQGSSDQELNMIRAMASKHLNWRKQHREELSRARSTGRCKCGAMIDEKNIIINRGYLYGIECQKCR
jgi:hypothetical protein